MSQREACDVPCRVMTQACGTDTVKTGLVYIYSMLSSFPMDRITCRDTEEIIEIKVFKFMKCFKICNDGKIKLQVF